MVAGSNPAGPTRLTQNDLTCVAVKNCEESAKPPIRAFCAGPLLLPWLGRRGDQYRRECRRAVRPTAPARARPVIARQLITIGPNMPAPSSASSNGKPGLWPPKRPSGSCWSGSVGVGSGSRRSTGSWLGSRSNSPGVNPKRPRPRAWRAQRDCVGYFARFFFAPWAGMAAAGS